MAYENNHNWTLGENKPKQTQFKPNFLKAKMNVNLLIAKDYRKNDDFAVQKNKPNSNPKQTQTNPISKQLQGFSIPEILQDSVLRRQYFSDFFVACLPLIVIITPASK